VQGQRRCISPGIIIHYAVVIISVFSTSQAQRKESEGNLSIIVPCITFTRLTNSHLRCVHLRDYRWTFDAGIYKIFSYF